MEKIKLYIQDSYNELMNKVSWPTWNELQSSAIVVLVATLIFGFVIFFIDFLFQGALNVVYNLFAYSLSHDRDDNRQ
jgi:preprotein translocase subunit SecE